jgi:hypothetical protein
MKRIAVVEDNVDHRLLLQAILEPRSEGVRGRLCST